MRSSAGIAAGLLAAASVACATGAAARHGEPVRTVILGRSHGLSGMTVEVTLRQYASGVVSGRVTATSGEANRASIARTFGCTPTRRRDAEDAWVCTPPRQLDDPASVLATLDQLGIMAPPASADPPTLLCSDGSPWFLTVRRASHPAEIATRQGCGPTEPRRFAFEKGMDSVLTAVVGQIRQRSTP